MYGHCLFRLISSFSPFRTVGGAYEWLARLTDSLSVSPRDLISRRTIEGSKGQKET